ncbi:NUDIX domain-containing protein [Streptomyces clavuligerus]|uniref:NUDIX domain-containing protein n=1 Tax=Streptomyces clavuligerus TaxID=1901 RepID=UPI0018D0FFBE|nr:NUDIX domain-containing protein [Streptomyces clavuligerus]
MAEVRRSAGLLLFRSRGGGTEPLGPAAGDVEVLLGHMGGPYWEGRDEAWSIPKGEHTPDEEATAAARREFEEELGLAPPAGEWLPLGEARQSSGKVVTVWALAGELDTSLVNPGTFTLEWPPRSGRTAEFPEIDRAEWFGLDVARVKLVSGQRVFLDRLAELLAHGPG